MCPIVGPLVPLFRISGDVSCGLQSQSGFCLFHLFCRGECNIHSPRSTSCATPANLLMVNITAVTSPHASAEEGVGNHPHRRRTCYHCASDPVYDVLENCLNTKFFIDSIREQIPDRKEKLFKNYF